MTEEQMEAIGMISIRSREMTHSFRPYTEVMSEHDGLRIDLSFNNVDYWRSGDYRMIVPRDSFDEFVSALVKIIEKIKQAQPVDIGDEEDD